MSARKQLLEFLRNEAARPYSVEELYEWFDIDRDEEEMFSGILRDLEKEGLIYKDKAGRYGIPEKFNLIVGRIERNPRGFSFLLPEDPTREDIYIDLSNMNGAMHNDKVFVRILSESEGKRREGEVVRVIERANRKVVGNLEKNEKSYFAFVVPDNQRIYFDIFIPEEELHGARDGQKVVARLTRWPRKNRNPEGKIAEILGFQDDPGVDIEAIIRQLDLPQQFPADVRRKAERIPLEIPQEEIENRRDLRDLPMVTIDGEDARDFDDAVSIVEVGDDILRLGVHIADVSHYVEEDSILDLEARKRGTSIYLVDRVIPMLPERLSNGICSLKPNEDRLALSVTMDYRLEPLEIVDYEIFPSVIRSNYRLTYDEVRKILRDGDNSLSRKYDDIIPRLRMMNKLRARLREERFKEGSIDFDFPEVKVHLAEDGKPVELETRRHGLSEQLIEEFMIAANRVVAEDMYWREIPFIYRVHDKPDRDRMEEFNKFVHNFGYHLKGIENEVHPRALQEVLEHVQGTDEEHIISNVLLRTMKKAIYSPLNIGHFGLALDYYTHFTSPIRRYPDLMIHRIIKEVLAEGYLATERMKQLENNIPGIAEHSSLQERRAMEAERDSQDLKKIEYMQDKIGYQYEEVINGVTGFGFFVLLPTTVEGLVHVEDLQDDYYIFKRDQQALIGERTGKIFRLGDKVEVEVVKVNLRERELTLRLSGD